MGETEESVARGCFNSIPRPQARWEAIKVFAGEDMEATVMDDLSIPLSPKRGGAGLIPGCGTKIPHAKKVKKKRKDTLTTVQEGDRSCLKSSGGCSG